MSNVLVVVEVAGGKVRKASFSAITAAREMVKGGGSFAILVASAGAGGASADVLAFGASKVIVVDDAKLANPVCEVFAPTLVAVAKSGAFDVVVMTATSFGKDIAPRIAAKLGAGYASDISGIRTEGSKLVIRRPMFAGNAFGICEITTPVKVISVRQTEFAPAEPSGGSSPVETTPFAGPDPAAARVEFVRLETGKSERPDLGDASVIVTGGRPLKERYAATLDPLANLLGAALGASRALCDAGHAPPELQVGQTGRIVAPKLYFAIGISGAIQHLAGMKGSKTIVAVNKDPEAPIFQVADYGIVADLFTVVPALVEELKKG